MANANMAGANMTEATMASGVRKQGKHTGSGIRPLRKNDTHKSRSVNNSPRAPEPPGGTASGDQIIIKYRGELWSNCVFSPCIYTGDARRIIQIIEMSIDVTDANIRI